MDLVTNHDELRKLFNGNLNTLTSGRIQISRKSACGGSYYEVIYADVVSLT